MSKPIRITLFILIAILGAILLYGFGNILAFILVSLTGWGWLFTLLRPGLIILFWCLMIWLYFRKPKTR